MTTSRDPDARLAAYLADGMTVLSDRVIDAVLDEAHRTRQRAGFGPRRTLQMFKPMFAAAAAIVAVVVGAYAFGLLNPPTAEPGATPSPTVVQSQSADTSPTAPGIPSVALRREVLAPGSLRVGLADRQIQLEVPADAGTIYGTLWPDTRTALFETDLATLGNFTIQSGIWQTNREWCHPTTDIIELPDTPDAIAEWLHGMAEADVTDLPDVTVDGRRAKAFEFVLHNGCYDSPEAPPGGIAPWQAQNEHVIIYAIPTDGQAILMMSFADAENDEPIGAFRAYLETIVRSMTFPG